MITTTLLASAVLLALSPDLQSAKPAAPATGQTAPAEGAKKDHDKEKAGDKISLFDGKSLAGWKGFLPEGDPAKVWSVKDGVLSCTGNPVGYLVTEKEYESFELTLEWRFDPTKGAGNSGVLLRVQQPDKVWPKSIEAQLHSENAGDIWNIDNFPMKTEASRTEGRRTKKAEKCNEKPLGEWNRYRIVLDGGHLKLFVNDVLQNEASDIQVVPGRIALQSEGSYIEFRNIELKPLGK